MAKVETFRDGTTAVFQFADTFISARARGRRERAKTSRIYLWGHDDVTVPDPHEVSRRIAGTYTTSKGEYPEVDKAFAVYNRAIIANYRRHLNAYREVLSEDIVPVKMSWSAYAGCSCPCSPGFITKSAIVIEGLGLVDLFVQDGNYRQIIAERDARNAAAQKKKALDDLAAAQAKVDALV